MKKILLTVAMIVMALPIMAQRNDKAFRISSVISTECEEEMYFYYSEANSTHPSYVKTVDDWGDVYADSLIYNEAGLLERRTTYSVSEDNMPFCSYIYAYDANANVITCTGVLHIFGDVTIIADYNYDENGRLLSIQTRSASEEYAELVEPERYEYLYNEAGLMAEEWYYSAEDFENFELGSKIKFFYGENGVLVKEQGYDCDEDGDYLFEEIVYEYDENFKNCVSETIYYDGTIDEKILYTHYDTEEMVFGFIGDEDDVMIELPKPTHTNRIKEHALGEVNENGEFEAECYYEYSYEEIEYTSVEESSFASSIYPNPVSDYVNIEAENVEMLELYDIFGRKLYSETISGSATIDMSSYSNGIYFLKLYSEGKTSVDKIVKK
ncbi:MAG: T9SS type A sorting domain-containing protein [Bacteroidales bacterium]|nr:T9SS type A sorting domain-containing protein [Bacteroidales bacterium]